MSDICRMCGLPFYAASFGGPGICSACDCGITPASTAAQQAKVINELRSRLAAAERKLAEWQTDCIDACRKLDAADALHRQLRDILAQRDDEEHLVAMIDAHLAGEPTCKHGEPGSCLLRDEEDREHDEAMAAREGEKHE
jgi:hypothetical protein